MLHPAPTSNVRCSYVLDQALLAGMKALGCAAQGTRTNDRVLTRKAYEFYGAAVQAASTALLTPANTEDTLLLAVMMLTDFEAIIGAQYDAFDVWSKHVRGISALIEMRGKQQVQSSDGRLLFAQVLPSLLALYSRTGVPDHIHMLIAQMDSILSNTHDPVWHVTKAWIALADFQVDVMNDRAAGLVAIIADAHRLDTEFISAFRDVRSEWDCTTTTIPAEMRASLRPLEYLLTYQSSLASQIWTSMRQGRLVLRNLVLKCLQHLPGPLTHCHWVVVEATIAEYTATAYQMQCEILASAPQFIGLVPTPRGFLPATWNVMELSLRTAQRGNSDNTVCEVSSSIGISTYVTLQSDRLPVLRTTRAYNMVWALSLVASSTGQHTPEHSLAIELLRKLGNNLSVALATIQANKLA